METITVISILFKSSVFLVVSRVSVTVSAQCFSFCFYPVFPLLFLPRFLLGVFCPVDTISSPVFPLQFQFHTFLVTLCPLGTIQAQSPRGRLLCFRYNFSPVSSWRRAAGQNGIGPPLSSTFDGPFRPLLPCYCAYFPGRLEYEAQWPDYSCDQLPILRMAGRQDSWGGHYEFFLTSCYVQQRVEGIKIRLYLSVIILFDINPLNYTFCHKIPL